MAELEVPKSIPSVVWGSKRMRSKFKQADCKNQSCQRLPNKAFREKNT